MRIYASNAQLATWLGTEPPANSSSLLRSASVMIGRATMTAYYAVDADGLPSDITVKQAFADATCAQAAVWIAAGVDPVAGGLSVTPVLRGKGIGSARLDYDTSLSSSTAALQARQSLIEDLCAESIQILQDAHVLSTRVWTYG